jgi:hypothetical protein
MGSRGGGGGGGDAPWLQKKKKVRMSVLIEVKWKIELTGL